MEEVEQERDGNGEGVHPAPDAPLDVHGLRLLAEDEKVKTRATRVRRPRKVSCDRMRVARRPMVHVSTKYRPSIASIARASE